MADKKQKGQLLSDFLKRAQEKQSESRVQSPFTAKGAAPLSKPPKPHEYNHRLRRTPKNPMNIVLEQPRAKNGSLFRVKNVFFFAGEKHIKLKSTNKIQH